MKKFEKPRRKVNQVFLHHSASDLPEHDDISVIRKWHLERGFKDVGYHYFITMNGLIQAGRPLEKIPAAQKGHNKNTIAICLSGEAFFSDRQKASLVFICNRINENYDNITFHGHKEVGNTLCPAYDYKVWLNLDEEGGIRPKIPWWETLLNFLKGRLRYV